MTSSINIDPTKLSDEELYGLLEAMKQESERALENANFFRKQSNLILQELQKREQAK